MNPYTAEFVGTGLMMLLGVGVNANVLLSGTKGFGSGWIVITAGWGLAVFVAVFCVKDHSGAHINPAVTVGLWAAGEFKGQFVFGYILAQLGGALAGTAAAMLSYYQHYQHTSDERAVLGSLCTAPAIRPYAWGWNLLTEAAGTFVLVFAVLSLVDPAIPTSDGTLIGLGSLGALPVGLLVFAIGLGLGGPTGYAINPARDLAPRVLHTLLYARAGRTSEWHYAGVPIVGPLLGAVAAAGIARVVGTV